MAQLIYHPKTGEGKTVFTESEVEEFRLNRENLEAYELRKHKFGELIKTVSGWTPQFIFLSQGLKCEHDLDLFEDLLEYFGPEEVPEFTRPVPGLGGENLKIARTLVGKEENLVRNKHRIRQAYQDLNQRDLEFIVYRSYRIGPATWDTLGFFTLGNFPRNLR